MNAEQITVSVDADVASVYRVASELERQKLDLLINLRLRDVTRSETSLMQVIESLSKTAAERGLTPKVLTSILDE